MSECYVITFELICTFFLCLMTCACKRYVRLRRTPNPAVASAFDRASAGCHPVHDLVTIVDPRGAAAEDEDSGQGTASISFVAMGTVAVGLALECQAGWARGATVTVVSALGCTYSPESASQWKRALVGDIDTTTVRTVITIEDDAGALNAFVAQRIVDMYGSDGDAARDDGHRLAPPRLLSKRVTSVGPSFRSLPACLEHFGFTPADVQRLYIERDANK